MNLLNFDTEKLLEDAFIDLKRDGVRITPEVLALRAAAFSFGEHRDDAVNKAMAESWIPACQTFLAQPGKAGPH